MSRRFVYSLAAVLALSACGGEEAEVPVREPAAPVDVTAVPAQTAMRTDRLAVSGVVAAKETAAVASRVGGTVQLVAVREGVRVAAGAPIAVLDDRELRSNVEGCARGSGERRERRPDGGAWHPRG